MEILMDLIALKTDIKDFSKFKEQFNKLGERTFKEEQEIH